MARFAADDSLWPLCITMAQGRQSPDLHQRMLSEWDGWFARGQHFLVLRVHVDAEALELAPGTGRATKQWLASGAGEAMRRLTCAMAIVVPAACHAPSNRASVEAIFGIPGGLFGSLDTALDWLHLTAHLPTAAQAEALGIVTKFERDDG